MYSNFSVTSLRNTSRFKNSLRGYTTHMRRRMWSLNVRYISHEPILDASTVFIGIHTTAFKKVRSAVVELFHTYSQIDRAISIPVPLRSRDSLKKTGNLRIT
jgi:hypothetical protein